MLGTAKINHYVLSLNNNLLGTFNDKETQKLMTSCMYVGDT